MHETRQNVTTLLELALYMVSREDKRSGSDKDPKIAQLGL